MGAGTGIVIFVLILIIFGLILYYNPNLRNQLFAAVHLNSSSLSHYLSGIVGLNSYFTETGLPAHFNWTVFINGQNYTSNSSAIKITGLQNKTYPFIVYNSTNESDCKAGEYYYIYKPWPSKGNLKAGVNESVAFNLSKSVACP